MVSTFLLNPTSRKIQLLILFVDPIGQISQNSCYGRSACYGLEGKSTTSTDYISNPKSREIQLLMLCVDPIGQISQNSCVGPAACYGLEGKSIDVTVLLLWNGISI